ncbi:MAG: type II secretion system F family protein [Oscillospiraceae bacterium]
MAINETRKNKLLSDDLLSAFCRDTAMLLDANIPLYLGYADIYDNLKAETPFKCAMDIITGDIEKNGRLSDALIKSGCFPKHLCDMAAIGEQTGRLEDMMRELSVYYDRMASFKKRISSAVLYPVILICMMTVVIAVLIYSVLPVFADVLSQFNRTAALNTGSVMRISIIVCTAILAVLIALLLFSAIGFVLSKNERGSQILNRFFEKWYFTKQLSYDIAASHFVSGLCAMLKSGFSVEDALKSLLPSVQNALLYTRLASACSRLKNGESQDRALIDSGIFGDMDNHLITVSGRTGTLDSASEQLSVRYDEKVSDSIDSLIAVIEPSLIACLTVVIGAVMLSVMLPLIRIMSSIG